MNGTLTSSEVNSLGSQVFIEFLTNGNGAGKGFSASIKFGKIKNQLLQSRNYFDYRINKKVGLYKNVESCLTSRITFLNFRFETFILYF